MLAKFPCGTLVPIFRRTHPSIRDPRGFFGMFSLSTRFQGVANRALTASVVLCGVIVAITWAQLFTANVWNLDSAEIANIKPLSLWKLSFNYGAVNRKPKENSKIVFDLETDLTPLFNWNTKQIFVYLTAEYPGKSEGSSNKVTYWDRIITSKDNAKVSLHNQRAKYSVWDVEKSFRERDAVLRLEWNIQPYVGPMVFGEVKAPASFRFAEAPSQ